MEASFLQPRGARDVVVIVGIAAVDDGVTGLEQRCQRGDGVVDNGRGHHQADVAWRVERADERLLRAGADGPLLRQRCHRVGGPVVDDTRVAAREQPPYHVAAHAAEPDHAELHPASWGLAPLQAISLQILLW